MIKTLKLTYKCHSCGSTFYFMKEIIIDEWTTSIKIVKPHKHICGGKSGFKLLNVELLDKNDN